MRNIVRGSFLIVATIMLSLVIFRLWSENKYSLTYVIGALLIVILSFPYIMQHHEKNRHALLEIRQQPSFPTSSVDAEENRDLPHPFDADLDMPL